MLKLRRVIGIEGEILSRSAAGQTTLVLQEAFSLLRIS